MTPDNAPKTKNDRKLDRAVRAEKVKAAAKRVHGDRLPTEAEAVRTVNAKGIETLSGPRLDYYLATGEDPTETTFPIVPLS